MVREILAGTRDTLSGDGRTGAIEKQFAIDSHSVADINADFPDPTPGEASEDELSQILLELDAQKRRDMTEGVIQEQGSTSLRVSINHLPTQL